MLAGYIALALTLAKLDCFCFEAHLTLTGSALLAHKFPFLVADALSLFSAARIR